MSTGKEGSVGGTAGRGCLIALHSQAEEGLAQLAQGRGRVPGAVGTQTLLGAGSWAQGHKGSPCSGWRLWGPDWPTAAALASCWGKGLSSLCPLPGLTQSCQWKLRHLGLSHSKAPSLPLTQVGNVGIWDQPHPLPSCHLRPLTGKHPINP